MTTTPLSLYELNNRVHGVLDRYLSGPLWLQAELSEVRYHANGHCYVEFVQKDVRTNALIAKARGTIWANVFHLLRPYFERETGQTFTSGIKVLVEVQVEFHELYGYSLTVTDIDPTYTVGDMARMRKEILKRLEDEGVLTLNKELLMPRLPQRIAVISSPTAAGYGDFCNQLLHNPYGLSFYPCLFPAVMQGERVEESVIEALNAINASLDCWDVVVIIRGGGAVSDLTGFDSYLLAANCAQFPLPIITGIGHERDDTVIDLIAHTRVKTPTAAAEVLIGKMHEEALHLNDLADYLYASIEKRIGDENQKLQNLLLRLPMTWSTRHMKELHRLEKLKVNAEGKVGLTMQQAHHRLAMLTQRVEASDFHRILKRGFALVVKNGKVMTDAGQLAEEDQVQIRMASGELDVKVQSVKRTKEHEEGNL